MAIYYENQVLKNKLNSLLQGQPIIEQEEIVTKLGKADKKDDERKEQEQDDTNSDEKESGLELEEDKD